MHFENSNSPNDPWLTWLHQPHVQYLVHLGEEKTMKKITQKIAKKLTWLL